MNICFDVDGTITTQPEFFKVLSHAVKKSGGAVHIVTSRTRTVETKNATREELKGYGIAYDHLFIIHDRSEADRICPVGGLDWYQRYVFQKLIYCRANKIELYIDDEQIVIDLFKRYMPEIQVMQMHKKE